jgi:hypothetical protein
MVTVLVIAISLNEITRTTAMSSSSSLGAGSASNTKVRHGSHWNRIGKRYENAAVVATAADVLNRAKLRAIENLITKEKFS